MTSALTETAGTRGLVAPDSAPVAGAGPGHDAAAGRDADPTPGPASAPGPVPASAAAPTAAPTPEPALAPAGEEGAPADSESGAVASGGESEALTRNGEPASLAPVGEQDFLAPAARLAGHGTAGLVELTDLERADRLRRMREGTLGSIHSWELVTAVDGPGVRLTVFLAGCPLRCLYCHNPDTFLMRDGEPVEVDQLLKRLRRYRPTLQASGGGLTLSGGEVLMQPAFAAKLLEGAKEMGVHTCIDTSGFLGANVSEEMLDNIDLVLLDVKSGIPETYKKVTGRELAPTVAFGDRLAERGTEVWARFVLVPGLTDDPQNIEAVADIVERWPNVSRVEVLPFHQMGADKWEKLGLDYELAQTKPPSSEQVEAAREVFRARGLTVF